MSLETIYDLVKIEDYVNFQLVFDKISETVVDFKVYEVTSWKNDLEHTPLDKELYLRGVIKWDGCSHFYFGDTDNNGYIHMCGKPCFDKHTQLIQEIWDLCSKKIEKWDNDTAQY